MWMVVHRLKTPVKEEDVRRLRVGDTVYVSGDVFTARDSAHRRALEYYAEGRGLPIDIEGKVLFHCGPLVRERLGEYEVVSAGPTTSTRMELFMDEFIENFHTRVIIGKGGLSSRATEAMKRLGAAYCVFTGGAGVLAGRAVKRVKCVEWLDLGMAEALWLLEVEDFGPVIVAIDTHGNNLYADVEERVSKEREKIYQRIG